MNDHLSIFNKYRTRSRRLPARVVRAIIDQQNASERLVGWFQLAFLVLFGSLYSIAPKAVSTEKTYEILPWFLIVYPDELICLLAEYQPYLVPIIQRHGGTIDKFLGDGIMATFGAAVSSQTFAADALKTTDAVMTAIDKWSADLQADNKPLLKIGAAVTAGQIIFGAVGDATRMEYTVIGDAVNLAAKLEKHTKTDGVRALSTAAAYETALRQGYRSQAGHQMLKNRTVEGVGKPCDVVILAH